MGPRHRFLCTNQHLHLDHGIPDRHPSFRRGHAQPLICAVIQPAQRPKNVLPGRLACTTVARTLMNLTDTDIALLLPFPEKKIWEDRTEDHLCVVLNTNTAEADSRLGICKLLCNGKDRDLQRQRIFRYLQQLKTDGILAKAAWGTGVHRGAQFPEVYVRAGQKWRDWVNCTNKQKQMEMATPLPEKTNGTEVALPARFLPGAF